MGGRARRRSGPLDLLAGRYGEANRTFHTKLYERCPYAFLHEQIQDLWDRMWRTRSRSLFRLQADRMARAQREHRAIFQAVGASDPERAAMAAEEHRVNTLEAWKQIVERMHADRPRPSGD